MELTLTNFLIPVAVSTIYAIRPPSSSANRFE